MPIVFVHGVNNREDDPGYEAGVALTRKFLERHFEGIRIDGETLQHADTVFPYWGDLATTFAWDMASLPETDTDTDTLGGDAALPDETRWMLAELGRSTASAPGFDAEPLLALANQDFPASVVALSDMLVTTAPPGTAEQAADLAVALQIYADHNSHPAWLATVQGDKQFVSRLWREAIHVKDPSGDDALGFPNVQKVLANALQRMRRGLTTLGDELFDAAGDYASTRILRQHRRALNGTIGRFFGDVFVYLHERGDAAAPGRIPSRILVAIDGAMAVAPPAEPLILVGHSLGAVVLFDLLGHFRPGLQVDLFVSVGSQVAHFEEIKRFLASEPNVPRPDVRHAATPSNIRHWINVYDEVDVFSYAAKRVFDRVVDRPYDTRTHSLKAHGAYFRQNRFYEEMRGWIEELA